VVSAQKKQEVIMSGKNKITSLDEAIEKHAPKIVVYGKSGVGKTTLIGSLEGRVLILSAEAGLLSLACFPDEIKRRLDVLRIESLDDLREAFVQIKSGQKYQWVVLDSASEIAEVILADSKEANSKAAVPNPWNAYSEVIEKMTSLLRAFRDLRDVGVYVTAKEGLVKDEVTGKTYIGISMPGTKLGDSIPYLLDEVFRLSVVTKDGESTRVLQTTTDGRVTAKDRSGALDKMEPADLGAIVEKIMGGEQ
jgi:phage nucleotide-binding protein